MITRKSKWLVAGVATLTAVLAFSVSASARIAANRIAANGLATKGTVTDKMKFDISAVRVSKVTLPDGTVLTAP